MFRWKRLSLLTAILLVVSLAAPEAAAKKKKKKRSKKEPTVATGTLDDGKLEVAWFSGGGLAFVEADEIDYLWVKEDFSMDGRTFHFEEWPDPEFLGEGASERDENDRRLARQMNADMGRSFAESLGPVFGSKAQTSTSEGDIRVEGRIVDCSTGNNAAKLLVGFGAGAGYTTVDLKFTDKASGDLLAAIHHRVVSGTSWSTTDSKFFKWIKKMGEELADNGFWGHYQDGDPVDD